jgi:hypothetical protein
MTKFELSSFFDCCGVLHSESAFTTHRGYQVETCITVEFVPNETTAAFLEHRIEIVPGEQHHVEPSELLDDQDWSEYADAMFDFCQGGIELPERFYVLLSKALDALLAQHSIDPATNAAHAEKASRTNLILDNAAVSQEVKEALWTIYGATHVLHEINSEAMTAAIGKVWADRLFWFASTTTFRAQSLINGDDDLESIENADWSSVVPA